MLDVDLKVRVRTWTLRSPLRSPGGQPGKTLGQGTYLDLKVTLRSPEGVGGRAGRDCIARRLVVSQEE